MRQVLGVLRSTGLFSRSGANALVAQLLTLAALIVPVGFGLTSALPTVVLAAAIASILGYPATLGAVVRVPPMGSGAAGRVVLRRSVAALLVTTGAVTAGGLLAFSRTAALADLLLQVAMVLLGQGLFFLAQARSIAALDFASVARVRLLYGVGSVVLTVVACVVLRSPIALSAAAALAMTVAALCGLAARLPASTEVATAVPERLGRTLRDGLAVGCSLGFGNVATQAPALVLPMLGPLAPAWSLITRLGNGFLTVGGNIVGPAVAIRFSRALQRTDAADLRSAFGLAVRLSLALGAAAVVVLAGAATVEWRAVVAEPIGPWALAVGVVGFWGTQVALAPIGNLLPMVPGGARYRIAYDVTRVIVFLAPIAVVRDPALLLVIGAAGAVLNLLFVLALRRVVVGFEKPVVEHRPERGRRFWPGTAAEATEPDLSFR
ncbi:hypothetical protein [Amnibacterium sp.]|uniref:hypothetical protein n=1 Tax=Amnibacterium sp. TaxID=1872496 RepID=UPI0026046D81|nr:hypothetical protein [Amnibacterium sp.]MCU1473162.1 hypothetical protein [Amnibacterium sp.]